MQYNVKSFLIHFFQSIAQGRHTHKKGGTAKKLKQLGKWK